MGNVSKSDETDQKIPVWWTRKILKNAKRAN